MRERGFQRAWQILRSKLWKALKHGYLTESRNLYKSGDRAKAASAVVAVELLKAGRENRFLVA